MDSTRQRWIDTTGLEGRLWIAMWTFIRLNPEPPSAGSLVEF
jgi:hypothetical protein